MVIMTLQVKLLTISMMVVDMELNADVKED